MNTKRIKIFLSYSHEDEWLKNELIEHLSALKRSTNVYVWHDRVIHAGAKLDENIDQNVNDSDVFLFLISSSFIASNYCMDKEYKIAKDRHTKGLSSIIPIIIRECDWDVAELRSFAAVPTDAKPIATADGNKDEKHKRDHKWAISVREIKRHISEQASKNISLQANSSFSDSLSKVQFIKHPSKDIFDEDDIFVEPELFSEVTREQINNSEDLALRIKESEASLIIGAERSGKTVLAKKLFQLLQDNNEAPVLLKGKDIKNLDIVSLVKSNIHDQYKNLEFNLPSISIIIDDFDECTLNDRIKVQLVRTIYANFKRCILFSYTSATSVHFAEDSMPDLDEYTIAPFTDDKLLSLVKNWTKLSNAENSTDYDKQVLQRFEQLQIIFSESKLPKYPYSAVTFLELIETNSGNDLSVSSFASCYDTLITQRLLNSKVHHSFVDETKNFLSRVAYEGYLTQSEGRISKSQFSKILKEFEDEYFSNPQKLRNSVLNTFISLENDEYIFTEEYLWYFLCAKHVSLSIRPKSKTDFEDFLTDCTQKIFRKKYANMLIYVAYFTNDDVVLECLDLALSELFSKAHGWHLSDSTRSLMLGISHSDKLISAESKDDDIEKNRIELLKDNIIDVLANAEKVVAKYTLPFLHQDFIDLDNDISANHINAGDIDDNSYIRSVNALLRIHSIIGHILNARQGTYSKSLILKIITSMVEASGRYASLNHAIAALLIFKDKDAIEGVKEAYSGDDDDFDSKFDRISRIFGFWSVYLSQAGLARYLSGDHTIKALSELVESNERGTNNTSSLVPYNYTSVYLIAKLYNEKKFDHSEIEKTINLYGDQSALVTLLRTASFIYSYYMPLDYKEKQWMTNKLSMNSERLQTQQITAFKNPKLKLEKNKSSRKKKKRK